ncbi:hypothetical protein BHE74_00015608 [Ensete ventricosum]|nr:hypothetical protein BHE74_00015608 [Ensete ventricosum]
MRPCKVGCVAQRPKELCKAHRASLRGQNNAQSVQQDGVVQGDGDLRNFKRERCEEESCSNRTDIQEG